MWNKKIHDAMEREANNALRSNNLTSTQMLTLLLVRRAGQDQLPLKELERALSVAQSTSAGIVSRLEAKGLLTAFSDPADRRVKLVRITPQGEAVCQQARRHIEDAEQKLLSGLTDTERDILCTLLQKVAQAI